VQKIYPASMLVLAGLAVPAAVSAQDPVPITATPYVVKGGPGIQIEPSISGSIVALTELTVGELYNTKRINYVDLAVPGAVWQVIPGNADQYDDRPHTSGQMIAFARRWETSVPGAVIMAFDVANPSAGPVVLSPASTMRRTNPAVGGDTVAFSQVLWGTAYNPARMDICVSSLSAPSAPEVCLTSDRANGPPSVTPDGNTVLWNKCPGGSETCDIYLAERDTASGTWGDPRLLADTGGTDSLPHTDGRLVTWQASGVEPDTGMWYWHIYYMSLDGTIPPRRVPLSAGMEWGVGFPHVSGNVISFEGRERSGLHLYDVPTGTTYSLPPEPGIGRWLSDMSHDTTTGEVRMVWSQWVHGMDYNSEDVWGVDFIIAAAQYVVQPLFNQSRAYKQGSVVPIRLQILDAGGTDVSSPSLALVATALVQTDSTADPLVVEDAGTANPDNAFRYDETLPGYVFNLSTKTLSPGTWELRFSIGGDTREYSVTFDVR
jgi:hypothetical protein